MTDRGWIGPIVERVVTQVLESHTAQLREEIVRRVREEIAAQPASEEPAPAASTNSIDLARAVADIEHQRSPAGKGNIAVDSKRVGRVGAAGNNDAPRARGDVAIHLGAVVTAAVVGTADKALSGVESQPPCRLNIERNRDERSAGKGSQKDVGGVRDRGGSCSRDFAM